MNMTAIVIHVESEGNVLESPVSFLHQLWSDKRGDCYPLVYFTMTWRGHENDHESSEETPFQMLLMKISGKVSEYSE